MAIDLASAKGDFSVRSIVIDLSDGRRIVIHEDEISSIRTGISDEIIEHSDRREPYRKYLTTVAEIVIRTKGGDVYEKIDGQWKQSL